MDIMGYLADHTGHFSLYDLPNLIFMILFAALLGWAMAFFGAGVRGSEPRRLALWAATAALAIAFVRMQLPMALGLIAIAFLVRPGAAETRDRILLFGALVIGMGCGSGASLIMAVAVIPYVLLVRWAFAGRVESERNA